MILKLLLILKEKFANYFALIRPINFLISIATVIIAAYLSKSNNSVEFIAIFLASLSAGFAGAAGNVINDYFDIEIDRVNRPERILPKGLLTIKEVLLFYSVLVLLSFIFITSITIITEFKNFIESFLIVLTSNILIFFYSFKIKKIPLIGNLTVSFMTGLAFIYGGVVVDSVNNSVFPAIFAFLINFSREIIKDIEDIEGDKAGGIITFPIKYGTRIAELISISFLLALLLLIVSLVIFKVYSIVFLIMVIVSTIPLCVMSIIFLLRGKKRYISISSNLLKGAMVTGLIAIFFGT